MTKEEKQALLQGLFQGANLEHAQVNVVVESGATVTYNACGADGKQGRKETEGQDVEKATQAALEYVGRLKEMVSTEWRERYLELFRRIFALPEVRVAIAVVGRQQGTTFNRNLVANCVQLVLQENDIFLPTANPSRMAERLENNKDHSVKAALGVVPPDRELKDAVKEVIKESKKNF